MTGFGDYEAADAWHPDDPVDVLARNLSRRFGELADLLAVRGRPDRASITRLEELFQNVAHLRHRVNE